MRSRRSTLKKPRVLVDTSFLLPALGVEVEDEVLEAIKLFRKIDVLYLELGLVEALWKVIRVVPSSKLDRVRVGVEAIRNSYRIVEPPVNAYIEAIEIYRRGHRDFVDALHYATARNLGIPWLTIDRSFIEFLSRNSYPIEGVVLTPNELKKLLELS